MWIESATPPTPPHVGPHATQTSRPHRTHTPFLLTLLLLALSALPSSAQVNLALYYTTAGVNTRTLSLYGDAGIVTQSFTASSGTNVNFYIKSASLNVTSSFITLGTTVPTAPSGSNQAIAMQFRIDPSQAVAGVYTQILTLTAVPNNNAAQEEKRTITLTVEVLAALNYYTNHTDPLTGRNNEFAPSNMTEGTTFTQVVSLRSKPFSTVTLTLTANAEWGEVPDQVGPLGQPLPGGGPLLNLSTTVIEFTPTNWNQLNRIVFAAPRNPKMQGSRWTTVSFHFASTDEFYNNLTLSSIVTTIIELDYAVVHVAGAGVSTGASAIEYSVTPGLNAEKEFSVYLGAQPSSPVTLSFPSRVRYTLSPSTVVFDSINFETPVTITISIFNTTVISGMRFTNQNFSLATSDDSDFNGLPILPLQLTFSDPNNALESISPPFASWQQSTDDPAYLIVTYNSTKTFLANSIGETTLPTVACIFGATQYCDYPENFFLDSGGCEYPYARKLVNGIIISPTQVSCPIPTCPSILSSASNPGVDATRATMCANSYHVAVLVNGEGSTNAIQLRYLYPIGSASTDQVPQVNSVEPTKIDVSSYTWITVHGANFDMPAQYPNPTLPSGVERTEATKKDLTLCKIGGIVAPSVDVTTSELDSTGRTVRVVKCLSRPRPDLAGSSGNVPVIVEISTNGQEFTSNQRTISLFDYGRKDRNNSWTYFFVVVALVGLIFASLILQHFLCANFFKTHREEEEDTKIRITKGPQMLIDLLEPQVQAQTIVVKELEKEEAARITQQETNNENLVKARIAEIQREAAAKREAKRIAKIERKLAKEAARAADRARNEVLAAAGLAADSGTDHEASESEAEIEKSERKRKKKEKRAREKAEAKAAKEAKQLELTPPPAVPHEEQHGLELAALSPDQLAALSPLSPSPYDDAGYNADYMSPSNAEFMSPSQAAERESSRSGYGSDASEKSVGGGSSKKKKEKKSKKSKKEKKSAVGSYPVPPAVAAELFADEHKDPDLPDGVDVDSAPILAQYDAEPMTAPTLLAESTFIDEDTTGGGSTKKKSKKSKKDSHSSKKKKKAKVSDYDDAAAAAVSPSFVDHLTSGVASEMSEADMSEVDGGESKKKKSKKSSSKKKKSKDGESKKKKKKSSKEE